MMVPDHGPTKVMESARTPTMPNERVDPGLGEPEKMLAFTEVIVPLATPGAMSVSVTVGEPLVMFAHVTRNSPGPGATVHVPLTPLDQPNPVAESINGVE